MSGTTNDDEDDLYLYPTQATDVPAAGPSNLPPDALNQYIQKMQADPSRAQTPSGGLSYDDLIRQIMTPQPVQLPSRTQAPDDGTKPGWLGLLGEALSGGQSPLNRLSGQQEDAAGSRALLNFGINMMLASGPHAVKTPLFSAVAEGLQGAQQSMDSSQRAAFTQAGAQFSQQKDLADLQIQQQDARIKQLGAVLPLLRLQGAQNAPNPFAPGGTAPPAPLAPGVPGAPGAPGSSLPSDPEAALQAIAQRESGGRNVPNQQGPGGTPASSASGYFQMIDPTWQEGAKLAGVDISQYPRAMNAPYDVQHTIARALYDKYGATPWAASEPKGPPGGGVAARTPGAVNTAGPPMAPPTGPTASPSPSPTLPPSPAATPSTTPWDLPGAPAPDVSPPPAATPPTAPPPKMTPFGPVPDPSVDEGALSRNDFKARNWVDPPFATVHVDPQVLQDRQTSLAKTNQDVAAAQQTYSRNLGGLGEAAAEKELVAAQNAQQTAMQNYNKAVQDAATSTASNQQQAIEKQSGALDTAYDAIQAGKRAVELKKLEGQQALTQSAETARLGAQNTQMNKLNEDTSKAYANRDQISLLQQLSDAAGSATPLANLELPGGLKLGPALVASGLLTADEASRYNAGSAFTAGIMKFAQDMRSGQGMGKLTNQELTTMMQMLPNVGQDPTTRAAVLGYMQQIYQRKLDFANAVSSHLSDKDTPDFTTSMARADADLGPIIKTAPVSQDQNPAVYNAWVGNLPRGTFYKDPSGQINLFKGLKPAPPQAPQTITVRPQLPPAQPQQQAPQ